MQLYRRKGRERAKCRKWTEDRCKPGYRYHRTAGLVGCNIQNFLLMGDETQRPDIIWWWNMEADYTKWVDAGLLMDVSPYMKKYTNMVDYYNSVDPGVMFYASGDNGIYRIPGDVAEPACETLWIRKDWLDNLGLAVPTTLDELDELKKIHGKQVEDYQKYLEEYNK
mgnify:CR=1 FL=1